MIPAGAVKVGDWLRGRSFKSGVDVFRKAIQVRSVESSIWRIVAAHKVSPCEAVYAEGQWMPAYRVPGASVDTIRGVKVLISLESDENDEQNYWLVEGTALLIHNMMMSPC